MPVLSYGRYRIVLVVLCVLQLLFIGADCTVLLWQMHNIPADFSAKLAAFIGLVIVLILLSVTILSTIFAVWQERKRFLLPHLIFSLVTIPLFTTIFLVIIGRHIGGKFFFLVFDDIFMMFVPLDMAIVTFFFEYKCYTLMPAVSPRSLVSFSPRAEEGLQM